MRSADHTDRTREFTLQLTPLRLSCALRTGDRVIFSERLKRYVPAVRDPFQWGDRRPLRPGESVVVPLPDGNTLLCGLLKLKRTVDALNGAKVPAWWPAPVELHVTRSDYDLRVQLTCVPPEPPEWVYAELPFPFSTAGKL